MKRTKQIKIKPRNPVAVSPILKKGGPHKRKDKRAERARQKAILGAERNVE